MASVPSAPVSKANASVVSLTFVSAHLLFISFLGRVFVAFFFSGLENV